MLMEATIHVSIFLAAALLCAMEPGPNFVQLSLAAMQRGRASANWTALGMHAGAYPYICASAFGLAGLLAAMPSLLILLKWVAGGYLLWLGLRTLMSRKSTEKIEDTVSNSHDVSAFRRGFVLVASSPRTPLFYATFPLLFVSDTAPLAFSAQILLYAIATALVFLLVDLAFVLMLDRTNLQDRLPGSQALFRWAGGGLLVALGFKQMLARN